MNAYGVPWYAWIVVALLVLGSLDIIWRIGKFREPITHSAAIANVFLTALAIWAIVEAAR